MVAAGLCCFDVVVKDFNGDCDYSWCRIPAASLAGTMACTARHRSRATLLAHDRNARAATSPCRSCTSWCTTFGDIREALSDRNLVLVGANSTHHDWFSNSTTRHAFEDSSRHHPPFLQNSGGPVLGNHFNIVGSE
jgi:hypothetical protein